MTRGAPAVFSRLAIPVRTVRTAVTTQCPECREVVPTRDGVIAGHYAVATTMCSGSSTSVQADS